MYLTSDVIIDLGDYLEGTNIFLVIVLLYVIKQDQGTR